jgi:predicted RNA binding protein YcfA (HicA-like mRNA interferase family)
LSFRETKRKLETAGFVETSQRGSHVKFVKSTPNGTRIVIVPSHRRDVPVGTLRSILRQSGLTVEEFDAL